MFRTLLASTALLLSAFSAQADGFKFIALGDSPYGVPAEVNPSFEALIKTINDRSPAFSVHIGDTKSGSTLCDNAMPATAAPATSVSVQGTLRR